MTPPPPATVQQRRGAVQHQVGLHVLHRWPRLFVDGFVEQCLGWQAANAALDPRRPACFGCVIPIEHARTQQQQQPIVCNAATATVNGLI
jgi:hypothetical protein